MHADTYYPRHSELDSRHDAEVDALQARVRQLEALLREADGDYGCHEKCRPSCVWVRARALLGAEVSRGQ